MSGTGAAANVVLGAAVAASLRMSLNSNLRKAAVFLHPHRHGNRTKKAGKNGQRMCRGSRLLLTGEEMGRFVCGRGLQSQLSNCTQLPLIWGKGASFSLALEASHADTLPREHQPAPFLHSCLPRGIRQRL